MNDYGFISFYDSNKESGDYGFIPQNHKVSPTEEQEEGFLKSSARYGLQIPLGIAQATIPGIISNLMQALGTGSALEEEELEQLRKIHDRLGVPFDEEKYMESLQQASEMFPTPSNIARMGEEATGLPLTPQTKGQKLLQLASSAGKFQTGAASQKATSAAIAPATAYGLEEAGLPEPAAELAGLIASGGGKFAPEIEVGKATKPSGLVKRGFEKLEKPREVSENKIGQINEKLKKDFEEISDRIIKESPIGETAENLRNDPTFKQESRELLNQAQVIADSIKEPILSKVMKKELADTTAKKVKGFALSEYDKSYMKYMKESLKDILPEKITAGELVEQYRKNNGALGEYFEPGSSKALNRAKKDALLDQNRAIAKVMEKSFPESELTSVFKEGNARWTKIMDAEAVDDFITDIFSAKVDYRKMHEFFDKQGYDRIFKRALGEKGYADFEQLMTDMLSSENTYKMLKVAKDKGYQELFNTGLAYVLHPKIAASKVGYDLVKGTYKTFMNSLLDKPQIGITFKKAIKELKKGDFEAAQKDFKILDEEIEILQKQESIEYIKNS